MAKVMVVDDAVSDSKLMESILRAAGHQVICYGNGEGLEEKVVAERPDVLLLDIVMPKRHADTMSTPVVLLTSNNLSS